VSDESEYLTGEQSTAAFWECVRDLADELWADADPSSGAVPPTMSVCLTEGLLYAFVETGCNALCVVEQKASESPRIVYINRPLFDSLRAVMARVEQRR
jgi:hypothetical protein